MELNPDFSPDNWKLGYQHSQSGVGQREDLGGYPSSALDSMSDPPEAMVTGAKEDNPPQDSPETP